MSDPNATNSTPETDDWAAAMAEQSAATQPESTDTDDWAAAMAEQATSDSKNNLASADKTKNPLTGAPAAAMFEDFSKENSAQGTRHDIDMILDIPVQLTVELGRTKIALKNLLQLAQGSVVELEGMAGEPMDVLVNGCLIAQGEVVVVNEKVGIRLTDIITPSERIRKLNR